MDGVNFGFLLFNIEFALISLGLLISAFVVGWKRKKRDKQAIKELIAHIGDHENDRRVAINHWLQHVYLFQGDELAKESEDLIKSEKEFYKRFIKMYISRSKKDASHFFQSVETLTDSYFGIRAPNEGADLNTNDTFKIENEKLISDLKETRQILNRLFTELSKAKGFKFGDPKKLQLKEIKNLIDAFGQEAPVKTESETKEPETKEPEAKEPEAKEPEAKEPEAKEPEAKEPEVLPEEPEAVTEEPEAVVEEPEAVVEEPEAVVEEPEAVVEEPEAVVEEPEVEESIVEEDSKEEVVVESVEDLADVEQETVEESIQLSQDTSEENIEKDEDEDEDDFELDLSGLEDVLEEEDNDLQSMQQTEANTTIEQEISDENDLEKLDQSLDEAIEGAMKEPDISILDDLEAELEGLELSTVQAKSSINTDDDDDDSLIEGLSGILGEEENESTEEENKPAD